MVFRSLADVAIHQTVNYANEMCIIPSVNNSRVRIPRPAYPSPKPGIKLFLADHRAECSPRSPTGASRAVLRNAPARGNGKRANN